MNYSEYPIKGKYGQYGGSFVPETLTTALSELETAYLGLTTTMNFNGS